MTARALMVQGTASHVGKSLLVTGLCRLFRQDGLRVAPFKTQNMSNNAFVTPEGGEIGVAQALQAAACGLEPRVEMNPILIKPEPEMRYQLVVMGKAVATLRAHEPSPWRKRAWTAARRSYRRLARDYDLIVIEGAGSPAEINLKASDIANMATAHMADAGVLLVADIDLGGAFASLVGTMVLLEPEERERVMGFVFNKFRGERGLLEPGLEQLAERTGRPVVGVVPYIDGLAIGEEDAVPLFASTRQEAPAVGLEVAVVRLPGISNFTDFEPLVHEAGVRLRYVSSPEELGEPALIILPGSKTTMADLAVLRRSGLARAVMEEHERGTVILGICGGYQMLGRRIRDPEGVEGPMSEAEGLGLLPVETVFGGEKTTVQVEARAVAPRPLAGLRTQGYEIHMGEVRRQGGSAWFRVLRRLGRQARRLEGAISADETVFGTSIHGLFAEDEFRRGFLNLIAGRPRGGGSRLKVEPETSFARRQEESFDRLAGVLRESLDMGYIYGHLFGPEGRARR